MSIRQKGNLTMELNMLRKALWVFLKPLITLITNLLNPEIGEEVLVELKKFNRKEPCWVKDKVTKANSILRQLYVDKVITVAGRNMEVYELAKDADFVKMYGSLSADLERLWMTKLEREVFCEEHRDKLRKGGYATFFLHKMDETKPAIPDNLFVADVDVNSDGLNVSVRRFEYDYVWRAERQHRLVSPQLTV